MNLDEFVQEATVTAKPFRGKPYLQWKQANDLLSERTPPSAVFDFKPSVSYANADDVYSTMFDYLDRSDERLSRPRRFNGVNIRGHFEGSREEIDGVCRSVILSSGYGDWVQTHRWWWEGQEFQTENILGLVKPSHYEVMRGGLTMVSEGRLSTIKVGGAYAHYVPELESLFETIVRQPDLILDSTSPDGRHHLGDERSWFTAKLKYKRNDLAKRIEDLQKFAGWCDTLPSLYADYNGSTCVALEGVGGLINRHGIGSLPEHGYLHRLYVTSNSLFPAKGEFLELQAHQPEEEQPSWSGSFEFQVPFRRQGILPLQQLLCDKLGITFQ